MFDLRCDGTRKTGPQKGLRCNYLLLRFEQNLDGRVETKCPRCNKLRQWAFAGMLVGATS